MSGKTISQLVTGLRLNGVMKDRYEDKIRID